MDIEKPVGQMGRQRRADAGEVLDLGLKAGLADAKRAGFSFTEAS